MMGGQFEINFSKKIAKLKNKKANNREGYIARIGAASGFGQVSIGSLLDIGEPALTLPVDEKAVVVVPEIDNVSL
jgi:hypothetical protein